MLSVLLFFLDSIALIEAEKILIIPQSIAKTANTKAMQNNASRIASDNGICIYFTPFHV